MRLKWTIGTGKLILILVLCLEMTGSLSGQGVNIGVPPIWNYSRKVYKAGTQNWDAAQDRSHRLYFANNDGLLRFDGTQWVSFPVLNHTIVRSVAIDAEDRIFVGAQSEIGYFYPDVNGVLRYHSLIGLLHPDQRFFEDVWDIEILGKDVFFRTNRFVFQFDQKEIRVFQFDDELLSMHKTPLGLIVQDVQNDLHIFKKNEFGFLRTVPGMDSPITGVAPWDGDTVIYSTLKNGLYYLTPSDGGVWKTKHDELLKEKRIYASTGLKDGHIALGTSLDGLIVLDKKRRVFRHLNKKSGLQNNNILTTFTDQEGNLWLGLDNGIDCVVPDSKFSTIFPDEELHGTGYHAVVFHNQLYLGVSNGAFMAPWKEYYDPEESPYFRRVLNGDGQVWGFTLIGDELWMGHHEGAFQLHDNVALPISSEPGTWTYVPLNERYMLAGTYAGLVLYQRVQDKWIIDRKIETIHESCRIMVKDEDGSVWVSHPYRGLYHVKWREEKKYDPDVKFFDRSGGLPSNLNNYVFSIAGKAIFGTESGVYTYDKNQSRFYPDTSFNHLIGSNHRVKAMKEDSKGNIWYVTDQEVGLLVVKDFGVKKEVVKRTFPELLGKLVGGFEFIYPVDEYNVIFGTEEGFIHYDAHESNVVDTSLQMLFNSIKATRNQDTTLFGGYFLPDRTLGPGEPQMLASGLNHLSFSYSAAEYKSPYLVQYRTMMEGLEEDWTAWGTDTRRDFTSLGPGTYTFKAQARLKDGLESQVISYSLRIRPPWFKTKTAMAIYGFGALGFVASFMMSQRRKFESEKAQMKETHQEKEAQAIREVELSKAALSEIQNEKLEVEIKYKNQELALTTMHLVQKAEILLSVQEGLHRIQDKTPSPEVRKEIQQLLNLVNFDVKLDEDWQHFARHFDQVHVDFLKQLREQFPQLSTSDLKLCAYLKMNLSTKEIAPLLNISIRGVEGSRYRLRKKLNLPNDANLTDFLLGITQHTN